MSTVCSDARRGTTANARALARALAAGAWLLTAACTDAPAPEAGADANADPRAATRPTPRYPDGRVRLDRPPGEKGYWAEASVSSLFERGAGVPMDEAGLLATLDDADRVAPFLPWALALYRHRQGNGLESDPTGFCIPPAGPRHLHAPGGFRIVQDRLNDRVYVLFGGGNRNWRVIFMDDREPPDPDEVYGTYYGHSTGTWQGDTLVVESSGFNTRFWFSNGGLPHTEALRLIERFSRPDLDTLHYEVTVADPATYTRPWTAEWTVRWVDGGEIEEQFCEDERR